MHVPSSHRTVVVNVGKGGQTVRWLATVAAQRARMTNQPHGSRRTREANLKFIGRFLPEQLMVTVSDAAPRTASERRMNAQHRDWRPTCMQETHRALEPKMLVRDAVGADGDSAHFTVPLVRTYETSDRDFGVKRSLWADSAFCVSPISRER